MEGLLTKDLGPWREECAVKLLESEKRIQELSAFMGLDGFVDEIVHVVDKRDHAESYQRVPTIARLAERLAAAAGRSTNIELVNQRTKLGGNGPIMANALSCFGMKVTYLGALGYPTMHPVFNDFAKRAEVHTIAESGHTDALEFQDGKVMLGKTVQLGEITWDNIQARFGRDQLIARFSASDLLGFVNWTMIPYMSDVWAAFLHEICPEMEGRRRKIFFDLADPEKRTPADIVRAVELIGAFEKYFDVIFGMNEKEASEVGKALGINPDDDSAESLARFGAALRERVPVSTLVIHPVSFALTVSAQAVDLVEGPIVDKPLITTGAGDHFNAGFCLGKLLDFDNAMALLTGVSASGYYVRTGHSPTPGELAGLLRNWPSR